MLHCCIAGCDNLAYTVYFGLMLCDACHSAGIEAIEACYGDPLRLEQVLCEFAEPNRVEDKENDRDLDVVTRIHRALVRRGLWTEDDVPKADPAAIAEIDAQIKGLL